MKDLKKKALTSFYEKHGKNIEPDMDEDLNIMIDYLINRATLAERTRCAKIARSQRITKAKDGFAKTQDATADVIAQAIEDRGSGYG